MKKNNIFMFIVGFLNFAVCLCLLILCIPEKIPIMTNFSEKITHLASKWFLILNVVLPMIFALLVPAFSNHKTMQNIFTSLFYLFIFENILAFSYFSIEKSFEIGSLSQIPAAVSIYMPISAIFTISAIKLKHTPFKSKFGIKTKHSTKTEFIWKQTHFYASEIFFAYGVLSFLISIVFVFVRMAYILLAIDVVGFAFCWLFSSKQAKDMAEKYTDMENRKLKQEQKNKG